MLFKVLRLVVSCVVLGVGVAMLLIAALGSDGYSTMINGLSIALDVEFFWVNLVVGIALVGMAWARGLQPGLGTIVQPVVVGFVVSGLLGAFAEPDDLWARAVLLLLSFPVLAAVGPGTLLVIFALGPCVDWLSARFRVLAIERAEA
ncbi:MAG: hypothetical protein M3Q98_02715 [Actinomycetota bacterium]|nr:hypothetical protein [Actinomycetota bacterium]